jgi:hypothetical protein
LLIVAASSHIAVTLVREVATTGGDERRGGVGETLRFPIKGLLEMKQLIRSDFAAA